MAWILDGDVLFPIIIFVAWTVCLGIDRCMEMALYVWGVVSFQDMDLIVS